MMAFQHVRVRRHERTQLHQEKIFSDDDLWRAVGGDFDGGIEALAGKTGIDRARLIEILTACATEEPDPTKPRWLAWPARHALDLLALAAVLFLIVLSLRAGGWLSRWPPPWGLTAKIPVTAKGLEKGQVIHAGDLAAAWLNPQPDQFGRPRDVVGFRLATDLAAGSTLRFADVMREQAIALQDLPSGAAVPAGVVARRWSAYRPDALLDPSRVIGRRVLVSIRKGEILTRDQLSGAPAIRAR
jgi:hypothetical protein